MRYSVGSACRCRRPQSHGTSGKPQLVLPAAVAMLPTAPSFATHQGRRQYCMARSMDPGRRATSGHAHARALHAGMAFRRRARATTYVLLAARPGRKKQQHTQTHTQGRQEAIQHENTHREIATRHAKQRTKERTQTVLYAPVHAKAFHALEQNVSPEIPGVHAAKRQTRAEPGQRRQRVFGCKMTHHDRGDTTTKTPRDNQQQKRFTWQRATEHHTSYPIKLDNITGRRSVYCTKRSGQITARAAVDPALPVAPACAINSETSPCSRLPVRS